MQVFNLALKFLLEIAMLVAFGYWGFSVPASLAGKIALGIDVPAAVATIWGFWMAPRSAHQLRGVAYHFLDVVLFLLAALGLILAQQPMAGMIFLGVYIVNKILLLLWKQ